MKDVESERKRAGTKQTYLGNARFNNQQFTYNIFISHVTLFFIKKKEINERKQPHLVPKKIKATTATSRSVSLCSILLKKKNRYLRRKNCGFNYFFFIFVFCFVLLNRFLHSNMCYKFSMLRHCCFFA